MAFMAKSIKSGMRIDIEFEEFPRMLDSYDLICHLEDCGGPMFVKAGMIVRPHFAHKSFGCRSECESHPESEEHRSGKRMVRQWLIDQYTALGHTDFTVQYEVGIRAAKRVADVLITFPAGMKEAHEVQLAAISDRDLEHRTNAYYANGISVTWWIGAGHPSDTGPTRNWLQRKFGEVAVINFAPE